MTRTSFAVYGSIAFGLSIYHHGFQYRGAADVIALVLFFALMWWLLGPNRAREDASGHESADNLVALRLGKALNRVRRRLSGSA